MGLHPKEMKSVCNIFVQTFDPQLVEFMDVETLVTVRREISPNKQPFSSTFKSLKSA